MAKLKTTLQIDNVFVLLKTNEKGIKKDEFETCYKRMVRQLMDDWKGLLSREEIHTFFVDVEREVFGKTHSIGENQSSIQIEAPTETELEKEMGNKENKWRLGKWY